MRLIGSPAMPPFYRLGPCRTPRRRTHSQTAGAALVWFRRDLRAHDHAALYHAALGAPRWCAFVFDRDILDPLLERGLRPTAASSSSTPASLATAGRGAGRARALGGGAGLMVRHGHAVAEIPPGAPAGAGRLRQPRRRARAARRPGARPLARGIALHPKDHVDLRAQRGGHARRARTACFTPYRNAWLKKLTPFFLVIRWRNAAALAPVPEAMARRGMPTLESPTSLPAHQPARAEDPGGWQRARAAAETLPRMAERTTARATSRPSRAELPGAPALRHLSIRTLAAQAHACRGRRGRGLAAGADLARLYHQILHHHPARRRRTPSA